ncbi:sulfite exporter TauE/SafE family protein [Helicobacter sp.]|uniref:sulfite exporter TauE/SafE family protein n=1 Tax=Helicobacter sp. TaxID=218 RepID=UPI0025BD77B6|nr:sulfite exporter TauE/SafE family protein [Helicobacter sp.]MBR2493986.1 sulfite exporter TauE/SafE family protein [Helicobacter sp.]
MELVESTLIPLGLVFVSALSLSLGHCAGMCGGIVLAYTQVKKPSWMGHLAYSLGRWCSYVCIGVAFALLGKAFALHHLWREFASLFVGVLLIVYAICYGFFPKVLRALEPRVQDFRWLSKSFGMLLQSRYLWSFFGIGVLNGLLPCGLVYFFALYTLNEQILGLSGVLGAVCVMSVFWLGSLPSMLGLGMLSSVLSSYKKQGFWVSFVAMVLLGLWNIYAGITTM